MKRIFVTGATGFIGSELTKRLLKEGHQVTALYRSAGKATSFSGSDNIRLLKGDLLDEKALHTAMQDCDEAYHLAAFAAMWAPEPGIFEKLNFEATRRLLEIAREKGVKKVVVTSTAGVAGPSTGQEVAEDTERKVDFFNEYERTKWQSEEFIRHWDSGPMQVAIVNPTRVFGPGLLSVSNGVTRMIDLYLRGRFRILPGKGHRIGNYAYIEDVVNGHLLAMEKGRHRERYLLGGHNVSYFSFFETLAQVAGRKYRQIPLPPQAIFLLSKFMLWRANRFGIPPLITPQWVARLNNYDWAVSSQKAKNELGYQITPFEQALENTVHWLTNK